MAYARPRTCTNCISPPSRVGYSLRERGRVEEIRESSLLRGRKQLSHLEPRIINTSSDEGAPHDQHHENHRVFMKHSYFVSESPLLIIELMACLRCCIHIAKSYLITKSHWKLDLKILLNQQALLDSFGRKIIQLHCYLWEVALFEVFCEIFLNKKWPKMMDKRKEKCILDQFCLSERPSFDSFADNIFLTTWMPQPHFKCNL